jgi:hypothetical protein
MTLAELVTMGRSPQRTALLISVLRPEFGDTNWPYLLERRDSPDFPRFRAGRDWGGWPLSAIWADIGVFPGSLPWEWLPLERWVECCPEDEFLLRRIIFRRENPNAWAIPHQARSGREMFRPAKYAPPFAHALQDPPFFGGFQRRPVFFLDNVAQAVEVERRTLEADAYLLRRRQREAQYQAASRSLNLMGVA